jgi:hypothetical protein
MSPVRYELGFYIPEDGILHSHRRDSLKSISRNVCKIMAKRIDSNSPYSDQITNSLSQIS